MYIDENSIDNGLLKPIEMIAVNGRHSKIILYNQKSVDLFCIIGNIQSNNEIR